MNMSEIRSFGEELRAIRERKMMSQLKLAQALGVNRQTVVAWELGKNPPKDRTRVLELARILDLDERETNILLAAAFLDLLPLWHVPYHRNPLFTGREELLQELHRVLIPGTTAAVTQSRAISGLGGIGKTQTVLEYAYRYRDDYSAVIWLQADSREIFSLTCIQLARDLGLPERDEADQDRIVAAVKKWLKSKTKWLLVLDNVEDFLMIEEFLPSGHHGCVLSTTRAQAVTEHLALIHELEVLPEEEGVLLLLRRAGLLALDGLLKQAAPADRIQAKELWEVVEGLPLALDQIGSYVRATRCSLAHYWALYVDQRRRFDLLKLRGKIPPGHPASVVATFSVAFEKVQILNPAATELLLVCAFLHPKAIPEEIISKGGNQLGSRLSSLSADPLLLDQAIDTLQTYSLVRRDAQESTLSIHRLVQAVLQDVLSEQEHKIWTERIIVAMGTVFPQADHTNWGQCERLIPHALICATHTPPWENPSPYLNLVFLLFKIACYFYGRAQYKLAELLYQWALHICEPILGPDHPEVTPLLVSLAKLYLIQSKYEEAELFCQRALRIQEQVLGQDHPEVASSLHILANIYYEQGKYSQAEPLYQQALRIQEQALGPEHPEVASLLIDQANFYLTIQDKSAEAERLYRRALRIQEQALGPGHPEVAQPIQGLANIYAGQGKYGEAEQLYRRAVHILEQAWGPDHPKVSTPLVNLAHIHFVQGKYREAERLYRRALRIQEQALGPGHPEVAQPIQGLANIYAGQGKYGEAEQLYRRAVHILEQAHGPDHPEVSVALGNLAAHVKQHKPAEAELLDLRASDIMVKALKLDYAEVVTQLNKMASFFCEQGKYEEAEPLFRHALHLLEQALGSEHPQIVSLLDDLAHLYLIQGKDGEVESLLQRIVHILEQALGPEHLSTAISINNLADLYVRQGKNAEAALLYQRTLVIYEKQLGPEHPSTAISLHNAMVLNEKLSKYEEVELLYKRALANREQQLGFEHPQVASLLIGLAKLYQKQGRDIEAEPLYLRALVIFEQQLAPKHPETAEIMDNLVQLREAQDNGEEARVWYARALAVREQALGVQHPKTRETRSRLIALLHAMGQYEEAARLEAVQSEQGTNEEERKISSEE